MIQKKGFKAASVLAVLAIVLSPVAASAATSNTTVQATVASVISVSSTPTVAISVTPTAGGAEATANDTVSVDSNDPDGYNLTLENDATLTMSGPSATTGTYGTPTALINNSWGYRLSGFAASTYAGVEDAAQNIKSTSATAAADTTVVTYAVKVDTTKPAGVYSDSVTYTATVK
jgi:hypothetical protein